MSRSRKLVKTKNKKKIQTQSVYRKSPVEGPFEATSAGLVDLHFHGAFGIDLAQASQSQLNDLAVLLWQSGIGAFCPTTVSLPPKPLALLVRKLGTWIRQLSHPGAYPIGIHLEGPFIHPDACGAHPRSSIRPLDFKELESLWIESQGTLKILTLAPENLTLSQLKKLQKWSHTKNILLSIGHSRATQSQAERAFQNGFQGVTHAWNALAFHQREPGTLGAALGRPKTYLEMIVDQVHIAPTVIQWLRQLHDPQPICFISDCLSAGGGQPRRLAQNVTATLGGAPIAFKKGACRFADGSLAGGGQILTESYCKWLIDESNRKELSLTDLFVKTLPHVTTHPLQVLGLSTKYLAQRKLVWHIVGPNKIGMIPIDCSPGSR